MKLNRRILSFIVALLLLLHCAPISYTPVNAEPVIPGNSPETNIPDENESNTDQPTEAPTDEPSTTTELSLNGTIYDAITDMVYGWDGTTYRFTRALLVGVTEGDDVTLVADVTSPSPIAGGTKIDIELSNFRLEGVDAQKYSLPDIAALLTIQKQIRILPKTIVITPADTSIYFGQPLPNNGILTQLLPYKDQLVGNDSVEIHATFSIELNTGMVVSENLIRLVEEAELSGPDAANYIAIPNADAKFYIREYTTDAQATSNQTPSGNFVGTTAAVLNAPNGFLISDAINGNWKNSLTFSLEETLAGTKAYYLRNNNPRSEYYQAICQKVYQYTSLQTVPSVQKIKLEPADTMTTLQFLQDRILSNGDILVSVTVQGGPFAQDTTIFLGKNGTYQSKVVAASQAVNENGKYSYTAAFQLSVADGDVSTTTLSAYAENASGRSSIYPANGVGDTFEGTQTAVSAPVIIDKAAPAGNITQIDGNHFMDNGQGAIQATFSASDLGSGIQKIEYLWDSGFKLNENNSDFHTEYVEFSLYSPDITEYTLTLPWSQAMEVPGNRHTLHVRITDHAGNVTEGIVLTDTIGSDMLSPNIESVEIRKLQSDNILQDIIRFLSFGTFYKKTVEVVVKVNDNESLSEYYASGIQTVCINDREATKIGSEYILTVAPNSIIEGMSIAVIDNNGQKKEAYITDVPENGQIESDRLIIEEDAPVIDLGNFLDEGHPDADGNIWFGKNDITARLTILVTDKTDSVYSGLYSVSITDNGQVLYQQSHMATKSREGQDALLEDFSKEFPIEDFDDGAHIIEIIVADNCGNTQTEVIHFYKDIVMPEKKNVLITDPEAVILDQQQWFSINDTLIFRVDAFDATSGLKSIVLNVNGQDFEYGYEDILIDNAGNQYVEIDVPGTEHVAHEFQVSAVVTDFADNTTAYDTLLVHVDTEMPTIENCTVEKVDTLWDKILRILTFGIYSNDSLVFHIYTNDAALDSGIDYATIYHNKLDAPEKMKDLGNGVFSFKIDKDLAVFDSTLDIVVYDRYGNRSLSCTNIADVTTTTVMIETDVPFLYFNLPDGDGVSREDNQVWYSSTKTFTLKVCDTHSGINNISLTVNGTDILQDANRKTLLKSAEAETATQKNTTELEYVFHTDYFTSVCGETPDGKYSIEIKVVDNAGNVSSKAVTYYMDKTPPVIDSINLTPSTVAGVDKVTEFIQTHIYGLYFKEDFHATVLVSDSNSSSGLYQVVYRLVEYKNGTIHKTTEGAVPIVNGQADIDIPKGFKGQIFVDAYDLSMNHSGEKTPMACVVDQLAPEIQIINNEKTELYDAEGQPLYAHGNSITVVITDTDSGLKEFGYQLDAEVSPFDRKVIVLKDSGYQIGETLGDGWTVTGTDANLVTQVTKTFVFANDDNNVKLTVDATDHCLNEKKDVATEAFTIDKTAPVIYVNFREDDDSNLYYAQDRIAEVTVIERNFDATLIDILIKNTFGDVPNYIFTQLSNAEYSATIVFDEGDYTFDVTGMDLGHRAAMVDFTGGNENAFYVDKTPAVVAENFSTFSNSAENSFRENKTAQIKVTEHHFSPELMGLRILRKAAGASHSGSNLVDITDSIMKNAEWVHNGDEHSISFLFDLDAVYYIELQPTDPAGNITAKHSTAIFEIDKTIPVVIKKNGTEVKPDNTQFLDLYDFDRKDAGVPTVEFADNNILHIRYTLTTYIPGQSSMNAETIKPDIQSGTVEGAVFTLPEFKADGIYAIELVAVDVAGNESAININTYARMVDRDILAFIMDSDPIRKTGLYSLEYENGESISKKPSSFEDLNIFILAAKEMPIEIVLRDSNGNIFRTDAQYEVDESIYGIGAYNYVLKADYFSENFQNDTDIELCLAVLSNQGLRIDLADIHIDNIAPECVLPKNFSDWHSFVSADFRTFTITNISEQLDTTNCKVYDNGVEIPFTFSEEDKTLTFQLERGWHNVGIILCDFAGNAYNIQEIRNIHVGYFWPIVLASISIASAATIITLVVLHKKKKRQMEQD